MLIKHEFPPIMDDIDAVFHVREREGIFYSWGDVIYNPSGVTIDPWLIAHEAVHGWRQITGAFLEAPEARAQIPDLSKEELIHSWWAIYLVNAAFRYKEELVAHGAEYRYYCDPKFGHDRQKRRAYLTAIAKRLCGEMYGKMSTLERAKADIKRIAKEGTEPHERLAENVQGTGESDHHASEPGEQLDRDGELPSAD